MEAGYHKELKRADDESANPAAKIKLIEKDSAKAYNCIHSLRERCAGG